jgi:hypothetical protein
MPTTWVWVVSAHSSAAHTGVPFEPRAAWRPAVTEGHTKKSHTHTCHRRSQKAGASHGREVVGSPHGQRMAKHTGLDSWQRLPCFWSHCV